MIWVASNQFNEGVVAYLRGRLKSEELAAAPESVRDPYMGQGVTRKSSSGFGINWAGRSPRIVGVWFTDLQLWCILYPASSWHFAWELRTASG